MLKSEVDETLVVVEEFNVHICHNCFIFALASPSTVKGEFMANSFVIYLKGSVVEVFGKSEADLLFKGVGVLLEEIVGLDNAGIAQINQSHLNFVPIFKHKNVVVNLFAA